MSDSSDHLEIKARYYSFETMAPFWMIGKFVLLSVLFLGWPVTYVGYENIHPLLVLRRTNA